MSDPTNDRIAALIGRKVHEAADAISLQRLGRLLPARDRPSLIDASAEAIRLGYVKRTEDGAGLVPGAVLPPWTGRVRVDALALALDAKLRELDTYSGAPLDSSS